MLNAKIRMNTSSRCHLSPGRGRRRRRQPAGQRKPEFLAPAPHRLVGDDDAALSQKQLNIAQAEAEHMIQPYSMADDDLRGEAMAVVWSGGDFMPTVSSAPAMAANRGYRDNACYNACAAEEFAK